MITFTLEDKVAESVVAILNAAAGHASFLETINEQFNAQFNIPVVVAQEAPKVKSKTKAAETIEGDK
jgi:hypothetical protein